MSLMGRENGEHRTAYYLLRCAFCPGTESVYNVSRKRVAWGHLDTILSLPNQEYFCP